MPVPDLPEVECEQQHPSLFVPSVPDAIDFYTTRLAFRESFRWGDPVVMAGLMLGNVQIFLERGTPSPEGCALYFVVGNADELFAFHRAQGVEIVTEPGDREYALRDYRVRDPHGYELSFGHQLFNNGPAIEIERVDVPVRLEKRLAALLLDLAEYKRMSLASCLEETLLHTLEGVGPHTQTDLRKIERLKEQHGIDYDSHASYRFREV